MSLKEVEFEKITIGELKTKTICEGLAPSPLIKVPT